MPPTELTCRVRVQQEPMVTTEKKPTLLRDTDLISFSAQQRSTWVRALFELLLAPTNPSAHIRSFDLVLLPDGSIDHRPSEELVAGTDIDAYVYPSRYRMSSRELSGVNAPQSVKRREQFALGSLAYEIMTSHPPFHLLDDEEVEARFGRGEFPEDVWTLECAPLIMACWSPAYARELSQTSMHSPQPTFGQRCHHLARATANYAKEHPYAIAFQAAGLLLSTASIAAVPVLGAVGFSAAGPVAGSAAAAWQSSLGLVQAGSLFAWCQSAAMGGAAINGIIAAGVVGAGVAGSATVGGQVVGRKGLEKSDDDDEAKLLEEGEKAG